AWLEYSLLRRAMQLRIGVVDYPASRVLRLWLGAIAAAALCFLLHRYLPIHGHGSRAAVLTAIAVLIPYGGLYVAFTVLMKVPIPGSLLRRFRRG
ncbi:MAG TPA: murein biosynthesis integral membrane protein MurJ, partial [Candidatus Koribacter sp.]